MNINSLVIYNNTLCIVIGRKMDPNFFTISNFFPTPHSEVHHETVHKSYLSPTNLTPADLYIEGIYSDSQLQDLYPELYI